VTPAVPATPAIPGTDGEPAVPATPAIPAAPELPESANADAQVKIGARTDTAELRAETGVSVSGSANAGK